MIFIGAGLVAIEHLETPSFIGEDVFVDIFFLGQIGWTLVLVYLLIIKKFLFFYNMIFFLFISIALILSDLAVITELLQPTAAFSTAHSPQPGVQEDNILLM
ncbi:hypothetical protein ACJX0J_029554, partial [Zea mays]